MALMENPDPWETQSQEEPNQRNEPTNQQLPGLITTSTPAPSTPAPCSSLPGDAELTLGQTQTQSGKTSYATRLPVEILCLIFEVLAAKRESFELKNCGSTCNQWANVALPLLYRYCGFGIFQHIPPQPYGKQNSYAAVPYSDSPFFSGRPLVVSLKLVFRQACYWRTLLLSCFWKDELGASNATSYPYLQYVENLDLLVMALVVNKYHTHQYRTIRNALFGVGTNCENFMAEHFGSTHDGEYNILPKMLNVLLPQIKHLKSVNVFTEGDVTGIHARPDKLFSKTIVQPILENVGKFTRLVNLEISGQENLTPVFGGIVKAVCPSFIGPDNKTINKTYTFSLRITGASYVSGITGAPGVQASTPNPTDEFHRNKGFLDALNENSVTMVDFDLTDDWGWNLDHISEFLIRQARTLKAIRLRGIGDTENTWKLLDRMGRRGCRVRGLDLENTHVHHPPIVFEPTAWTLRSGLLKKLKYLAVEGFQGITNSATNYHMIDPTSFSILLKSHLFCDKSTGARLTPPVKALVLNRTATGSKVPEQIGAFVMHLAPTLTTLELGYLSDEASTVDFTSITHSREQGRYKLIKVLMKLTALKRLKAVGYAAEILLCSCIIPTEIGDAMGNVSRPRSPPRPPTPVGFNVSSNTADMGSLNFDTHFTPPFTTLHHPTTGVMLPLSHRPALSTEIFPALPLLTSTWRSSLEELELVPSGQTVFTVYGGLVDDTLLLFTQLQKLRVFTLLFGDLDNGVGGGEEGLPLRQLHFNGAPGIGDGGDDQWSFSSEVGAGDLQQLNPPGKITPDGLLRFVNELPRMTLLHERVVMQKFRIGERFMNPELSGIRGSRVAEKENWPQWAVHIAGMMKGKGMDFALA